MKRIVLTVLATLILPPAVEASYLCASPSGSVKLRVECRRTETRIDPDEIGFRGSTGPAGEQGPAGVAGPQGEPGNASDGRSLGNLVMIRPNLSTGTECVPVRTSPAVTGVPIYTVPPSSRFVVTALAKDMITYQANVYWYVYFGFDGPNFSPNGLAPSLADYAGNSFPPRSFADIFPAGLPLESGESIFAAGHCSTGTLAQALQSISLTGYLIPDE